MWQDILGPGEMQRSPGLSWKKEGSDLPLEFHILFIYLLTYSPAEDPFCCPIWPEPQGSSGLHD